MKFALTIKLGRQYFKLNKKKIKMMLSKKTNMVNGHSRRIINVLITTDHHIARTHDEMHDTLTVLLIKETMRVEGGIVVSYPEDIERNLQSALDRLHVHEQTTNWLIKS